MKNRTQDWFGRTACIIVAIIVTITFFLNYAVRGWNGNFIDFPSYWVAAVATYQYEVSPYGSSFSDVRDATLDQYAHPFIYPPPSLPLFWPFAQFEEHQLAGNIFLALNTVLTIASGLLTVGLLKRKYSMPPIVWLLIFIAFPLSQAVRITLGHGQVNIIALTAILASAFLVRRFILAGVLIAFAVLVKVYAIITIFCFYRHRWVLLSFVLTVLFFSILAHLTSPLGLWRDWVESVLFAENLAGVFSLDDSANISLVGLCARLELPVWIGRSTGFLLLIATLFALYFRHQSEMQAVSMVSIMIVLLPSISWIHYAVFLLPAYGVSLVLAISQKSVFRSILTLTLGAFLTYNPLAIIFGDLGNLAITIIALILWGILWLDTMKSPRGNFSVDH